MPALATSLSLALIVVACLLGSLSGSLLLGWLRGVDVRTQAAAMPAAPMPCVPRAGNSHFAWSSSTSARARWRRGWRRASPLWRGRWRLVITGYVGLASVTAVACALPLALWSDADAARLSSVCAVATLVVFTHRGNLQRLRAGSESRFERVRLFRQSN